MPPITAKPPDLTQIISLGVTLMIVLVTGAVGYGNLTATVQQSSIEQNKSLARIESRMDQFERKLDAGHDHSIEMDMRLKAIETKLGMADGYRLSNSAK